VVETPDFLRKAKALLTETERAEVVDTLSANPDAGVSLGRGLWKVRFARHGEGKSGGFRTIHFYRADAGPLFLLTMFAKKDQANLSEADLTVLYKIGDQIAESYGRRT
jgi:hypothetical protein